MKLYLFIFSFIFQIWFLDSKIIPEYLPRLCSISENNNKECSAKALSAWGPHLLNGIEEINFPKLHPLHIPLFIVNRTLNENVAINAVLKNLKFYGFNGTQLRYFKFDPNTKNGELSLHIPYLRASIQYNVSGHIFSLDVGNSGYFRGMTTDVELLFAFKLKTVERLGVKYFTFEKFIGKSTMGNAHIKLLSKDPEFQFVADLITNFFNENPKRILDAIHPIYEESVTHYYGGLAEQVLRTIPAQEIIPE